MVDKKHKKLSVRRQCELLGIARSGWYYQGKEMSRENVEIMNLIDEQYTLTPYYGSPKMTAHLKRLGHRINIKRVRRLMRMMGITAVYPKPKTSTASLEHRVYPYLLKNLAITQANQVWCTDITYIRMQGGFMYLVAIMDWYSRYVLSWELSNSLDTSFCEAALNAALAYEKPKIFNTDQGSQFTSDSFTKYSRKRIQISMMMAKDDVWITL